MSTTQNTVWLEAAQETFDEAVEKEDWATVHAVIEDVNSKGFEHAAVNMRREMYRAQNKMVQEEEYQERKEKNLAWLTEMGRTEGDVMEDENGEYVYLESETGLDKTYLPFANEIDKAF